MMRGRRIAGVLSATMVVAAFAWAQLPEIAITITPRDSAELYTRDLFDNTLVPVRVDFKGTTWNDVGIRFKGRSHRYYSKKSFRLKFSDDHPFLGRHHLNLHSLYSDKSFIREKLSWILFREMGALAPDGEFLRLKLNGRPSGLYFMVDRLDKGFLERHARTPSALYSVDDEYSLGDLTEQPDELLKLYYPKQVGEKQEIGDLKAMLHDLWNAPDTVFEREAGRIFDMQSVYTWLAGNILMMMGDSYNKNYYLYHDLSKRTGSWVIIPWDYDESFGLSGDPALEYPASLLNDGFGYTFPPLAGPGNVLKDRLWNSPAMREHLRVRVAELLDRIFTEARMGNWIDSLAAVVRPEVGNDPLKWGTVQEFEDHIEALKQFVIARREFLLKTFVSAPGGDYTTVTLPAGALHSPMRFVSVDGRLLGTMVLSSMNRLDSIRLDVHPGILPPAVASDSGKFVRRWLEIRTMPQGATCTARLEWMYHDLSSRDREVPDTVPDEGVLRCVRFDGSSWKVLPSRVNPASNTVFVDSLAVSGTTVLGIQRR